MYYFALLFIEVSASSASVYFSFLSIYRKLLTSAIEMRFSISFLSVLSAASAVQAQGLPIFNASDERFGQYQAAGPGDCE